MPHFKRRVLGRNDQPAPHDAGRSQSVDRVHQLARDGASAKVQGVLKANVRPEASVFVGEELGELGRPGVHVYLQAKRGEKRERERERPGNGGGSRARI